MSRIETREAAVSSVFQAGFRSDSIDDLLTVFKDNNPVIEGDEEYFDTVVRGVLENKEDIDSNISKYLKNWKLERLPMLDVAIMEVAIFEILNLDDIATSVSINEAVKIAKKYSTEKSSSYINGVLSSFEKNI